MTANTSAEVLWSNDIELLNLATLTFQNAGYQVQAASVDGLQTVRAKTDSRLVLTAALVNVEDVLRAEQPLTKSLVDEMASASSDQGSRVEGYLALLSTQDPGPSDGEQIFSMTYNLRYIRRIIRVGVQPTPLGVARALRAVLPLPGTDIPQNRSDAFDELTAELERSGADIPFLNEQRQRFIQSRSESDDAGSDAPVLSDEQLGEGDIER